MPVITAHALACRDAPVHQAALLALLSEAEHARIAALRRPEDRLRSLIGRAAARLILARRLRVGPRAVIFQEGPHGKPELDPQRHPGTHFNIAHSGEWVLLAVADSPVGVDIEHCATDATDPLLQACFTEREQARIHSARDAIAQWTAKEAVLKAGGYGLTMEPASFEVPHGGSPWSEVSTPPALSGIRCTRFSITDDYCAALAACGPPADWRLIREDIGILLSELA